MRQRREDRLPSRNRKRESMTSRGLPDPAPNRLTCPSEPNRGDTEREHLSESIIILVFVIVNIVVVSVIVIVAR